MTACYDSTGSFPCPSIYVIYSETMLYGVCNFWPPRRPQDVIVRTTVCHRLTTNFNCGLLRCHWPFSAFLAVSWQRLRNRRPKIITGVEHGRTCEMPEKHGYTMLYRTNLSKSGDVDDPEKMCNSIIVWKKHTCIKKAAWSNRTWTYAKLEISQKRSGKWMQMGEDRMEIPFISAKWSEKIQKVEGFNGTKKQKTDSSQTPGAWPCWDVQWHCAHCEGLYRGHLWVRRGAKGLGVSRPGAHLTVTFGGNWIATKICFKMF